MYLSLFSTSGLAFFFTNLFFSQFWVFLITFCCSVTQLCPTLCTLWTAAFQASLSSVQFSCSVISDSLRSHGLQHTRPPCPSPAPGACSNSSPLSRWCHPTISSSVVHFSCLQSFPASGSFSSESVVHIRWPKYWSFSFSPSNEYSGLISFRSGLFDLTQKSSPTPQFKSINSLVLSFLYGPTLTSIHDYWKDHSFDCMDLCQKSDVSAF